MTREKLIKNLEYTMKKHEHDKVDTFGTNISMMCKDMIDYLEQEPKWIPVSERLPNFNDIVLASADSDYEELRVILTVYGAEEFWFNGKIKAWMPSPEPYRAESEE